MNVSDITLGSYADAGETTHDRVVTFLRDVGRASLPDIVGATSGAWAVCHGAVQKLIKDDLVVIDESFEPWEYVWKAGK